MDTPLEKSVPWFDPGLRFKCTGCGKCCTGSGSYVFLSQADLSQLADFFQLSLKEFSQKYAQQVDDKITLLDKPDSNQCIFLTNNQCEVYAARPIQCRTFPWWVHLVRDQAAWEQAKSHCEGIEHEDAPLVSSLVIQQNCLTYLDNLLEQNFSLDFD